VSQIKIYGLREHLDPIKQLLSDVIHSCIVDTLSFPKDKRAHRFFPMESADFYYPASASSKYTIIEISMFEGRSVEAKKHLLRLLLERIPEQFGIPTQDVEITITETPKHNWGIRGLPGDEVGLNYKVDV
jgi:phenylpyruvate tautomerase PptA (4-oxalocrotonate tautomerase family)